MFYSIVIGIDPYIFELGAFTLSWHGFFTFVAVALAVFLIARWGSKDGIDPDTVYSLAVWAIIGGILGARVAHVIDRWDFYGNNLSAAFSIWSGGLAIYGAIIGGFIAGALYIWINTRYRGLKGVSVGRLADIAAPAILLSQAVGRIGDVINGEHVAEQTSMPWGFIYTHYLSASNAQYGRIASHPAVLYELLFDLVLMAVILKLRGRLAPSGMLFVTYGMLYSFGRFFIQFLRLDKEWFAGLTEAHIVALLVLAITVAILATKARWVQSGAARGSD